MEYVTATQLTAARGAREPPNAACCRSWVRTRGLQRCGSEKSTNSIMSTACPLSGKCTARVQILPAHNEHRGRRTQVSECAVDFGHHMHHRRTRAGLAEAQDMKVQMVPFACGGAFTRSCGEALVLTCGGRVHLRRGWSRCSRSSGSYAEHESDRSRRRTTVGGCHGPWLTSSEKIDLHAGQVTMTRPRHNRAADPERGRRDGPKTVRNTPGG